jgi:hypothetical protein
MLRKKKLVPLIVFNGSNVQGWSRWLSGKEKPRKKKFQGSTEYTGNTTRKGL